MMKNPAASPSRRGSRSAMTTSPDGGKVPSRDLFAFDGRLGAAELTGTLKRTDRVHDDNDDVTEQIRLKKQRDKLPSYPSPDA